jgi:hypothetical protein
MSLKPLPPGTPQLDRDREAELQYDAIMTELDLAVTFCRLSLSSRDPITAMRNANNGRKATLAAKRFLEGSWLSPEMKQEINAKMDQVASWIAKLKR